MHPGARPTVQVRRIMESDLEAFRELRLRALATDPMAFGDTLEGAQRAEESGWRDWVRRSSSLDDAITFLASTSEGPLVGMLGSVWKEGVTWLGAMWVDPRFRGLGAGGLLLDSVLAWSDSIHAGSEVRLYVAPAQEAAIRLYRDRGFVTTGKDFHPDHAPRAVFHEMLRTPKSTPS